MVGGGPRHENNFLSNTFKDAMDGQWAHPDRFGDIKSVYPNTIRGMAQFYEDFRGLQQAEVQWALSGSKGPAPKIGDIVKARDVAGQAPTTPNPTGLINQSVDRPNITPASIANEHALDMTTNDRLEAQASDIMHPSPTVKAEMAKKVDAFANDVQERLGLQQFSLNIVHGDLGLDGMRVAPDFRNQGVGAAAMKELTDFADANGLRVRLSPATKNDRNGTTSRERLVDFYKRFGFVENKGRNIDHAISDGMYRMPQAPSGGIINSVTQKKD